MRPPLVLLALLGRQRQDGALRRVEDALTGHIKLHLKELIAQIASRASTLRPLQQWCRPLAYNVRQAHIRQVQGYGTATRVHRAGMGQALA